MKWFRSNIKHGSLLALTVQFVLSFGQAWAAEATPVLQWDPAQSASAFPGDLAETDAVAQSDQQAASNRDSGRHPNDRCAICAVVALANEVLFATPPLLLLPEAVEFLYLTTDAEFLHLNSVRIAFEPRTPHFPTSSD